MDEVCRAGGRADQRVRNRVVRKKWQRCIGREDHSVFCPRLAWDDSAFISRCERGQARGERVCRDRGARDGGDPSRLRVEDRPDRACHEVGLSPREVGPKSQVGSARLCACSRLRGAAAPTVSRARAGCRLSLRRTESQSVLSGGVGSPRGSEFHRGARPQGSVASIARGLARRDRALGRLRVEGSQGVRELSPSCSRILIESPSGMHGARGVRILPDDSARDAQDV